MGTILDVRTSLRLLIVWAWIVALCAAVLLVAGALPSEGWAPAPAHAVATDRRGLAPRPQRAPSRARPDPT
jgi:hypothetical protein